MAMKRMWSRGQITKEVVKAVQNDSLEDIDVSVGSLEVNGNAVINGEVSGDIISAVYDGAISPSLTETLGLTVISSFIKAFRNFNELQFIFNCRLKNSTGESVAIGNDSLICRFDTIPSVIKNKIYKHDGNPVGSSGTGSVAATTLYLNNTGGSVKTSNPRYISFYALNGALLFYNEGGTIPLDNEEEIDLEARISLAL